LKISLDQVNVQEKSILSKIKYIEELNIGHFLIGDSIFNGLQNSILKMRDIIKKAQK